MASLYEDLSSSKTLKDKVYLHIRQLIITGQIPPGCRLPEEDLSHQMNISRAPIREALNMLARDGFATIIPRHGAVVSELDAKVVQDIWELRGILEPYTARKSMSNMPSKEIDEVYALSLEVQANPTDFDLYMNCDMRLHNLLYQYEENTLLKDEVFNISEHSLRARYLAERGEHYDTVSHGVCEEHVRIMKALKEQDADEVYAAVKHHVNESLKRCVKMFEAHEHKKA